MLPGTGGSANSPALWTVRCYLSHLAMVVLALSLAAALVQTNDYIQAYCTWLASPKPPSLVERGSLPRIPSRAQCTAVVSSRSAIEARPPCVRRPIADALTTVGRQLPGRVLLFQTIAGYQYPTQYPISVKNWDTYIQYFLSWLLRLQNHD
eukprot:6188106-Pleurochrysis_carterae.AAC.9